MRGSGRFPLSLVFHLKSSIEPPKGLTERRNLMGKIPALLNSKIPALLNSKQAFLVRSQASSLRESLFPAFELNKSPYYIYNSSHLFPLPVVEPACASSATNCSSSLSKKKEGPRESEICYQLTHDSPIPLKEELELLQ